LRDGLLVPISDGTLLEVITVASRARERVPLYAADGSDLGGFLESPVTGDNGRLIGFNWQGERRDGSFPFGSYVTDADAGTSVRVDVAADGTTPANPGQIGDLTSDGRGALFLSFDALVPEDTNDEGDPYLRLPG
jgi:hypothetical protein